MTYRLKRSDKDPQDALRRIAREEIDAGLAELEDTGIDLHERVHQVRKRAKRLRGLIRLVRPHFAAYAEENAAIRDAARRISGLRDREAMIETFDKLAAATGACGFDAIRAELVARRDAASALDHVEQDLAAFRAEFEALRARVAGWRLAQGGFGAYRPGLERIYSRARRDRRLAAETPDVATIHDWRKAVKYHWYHTRLMAPIAPAALDRRAEQVRDLSELLGDHHDLAVLGAWIAEDVDLPDDPALWQAFRGRIAARQAELETEAQALATRLFASPAKDLGRRWKAWWTAWRRG